jgi:hypothetical protein
MRHDAIEIEFPGKAVRRRDAERMLPFSKGSGQFEKAALKPASDARDEAFAGMSQEARRPRNLSVVSQLSEQLLALDRQREQLAKLLRDIEITTRAD